MTSDAPGGTSSQVSEVNGENVLNFVLQNPSSGLDVATKRSIRLVSKSMAAAAGASIRRVRVSLSAMFSVAAPMDRPWPFPDAEYIETSIWIDSEDFMMRLVNLNTEKLKQASLRVNSEALPALASANWPDLEDLSLEIAGDMPCDLSFLAASRFTKLRKLKLKTFGLLSITNVTGLNGLPGLSELILKFDITDTGAFMQSLASCTLTNLRRLEIDGGDDNDSVGIEALASAEFPALEEIHVKGRLFQNWNQASQFAQAPWLPRLRTLHLNPYDVYDDEGEPIFQDHLALMLDACRNGSLEDLVIAGSPFDVLGAFGGASLPRLTRLHIARYVEEPRDNMVDSGLDNMYLNMPRVDEIMEAFFHAHLPALRDVKLDFVVNEYDGRYFWILRPEDVASDVFFAIESFELGNLRIHSPAASFLASTFGNRPGSPLRLVSCAVQPYMLPYEQDRVQRAIRRRLDVSKADVLAGARVVGWDGAALLGVMSPLEYKAAAFRGKAAELSEKARLDSTAAARPTWRLPPAVVSEAAWYLAASVTDPELFPENQESEEGKTLVREARRTLERVAQITLPNEPKPKLKEEDVTSIVHHSQRDDLIASRKRPAPEPEPNFPTQVPLDKANVSPFLLEIDYERMDLDGDNDWLNDIQFDS